MLLRTSHQYVKPGFDFVRWLLALRRKWYLFIISVFIGLLLFTVVYNLTPVRYDVTAMYFINKDVETDIYGAEIRIPLLRIFAKQNNIENHIGVLKSNEMLYDCLLEQNRHLSYSSVPDSTDIKLTFTSDFYPVDSEFKVERVSDDSLKVTHYGGYKRLILKSNGYLEGSSRFKKETKTVALNEELQFGRVTLKVESNSQIPQKTKIRTYDLQSIMGKYDQRVRIKTLNKRATIISIGLSTDDPALDTKLVSLLMNRTIEQIKSNEVTLATNTADALRGKLSEKLHELEGLSLNRQKLKQKESITDYSMDIRSKLKELSSLYEYRESLLSDKTGLINNLEELQKNGILISPLFLANKEPSLYKSIQEYHSMVIELESDKILKSAKNPSILTKQNQVNTMKSFVLQKLKNIIDHHDFLVEDVTEQVNRFNTEIDAFPLMERDLGSLERKIAYLEKETFRINKKLSETLMAPNYNSSNINVLEKASPKAKPFAPLKAEGYIVTLLIVLFFPLVVVFLDGIRGSRIFSEAQIEQLIKEKPVSMLNRFIFKRKRPFIFSGKGERYCEEFILFFKEILFDVHSETGEPQNLALGVHILHQKKDGLHLTSNLTKCALHLGYSACKISFEHHGGAMLRKKINLSETNCELVLNSKWLDNKTDLESLLAEVKEKYNYTFIGIPMKIPNERRTELSQHLDVNLGLAREHYTREHNLSSFKEALDRISTKKSRIIFLKGYIKRNNWFNVLEQYKDHRTLKELLMSLSWLDRTKFLTK